MIYMKLGEKRLIVLEAGNLELIKEGRPAVTPDTEVMICYTPDIVWLADQINGSDMSGETVARLIEESSKRPQTKADRPYHKPFLKTK